MNKLDPIPMQEQDSERDDEMDNLQDDIAAEILNELSVLADPLTENNNTRLALDVQPPVSVICLASQAAAAVFVAFERGYRMTVEEAQHD